MSKENRDFFKKKNQWSEIKDQLLGCYLTPYFQKMLSSHAPICYIDGFSGKGLFDDGQPGSPIIALNARESCMNRTKCEHGRIETYFIELNYAHELTKNIVGYDECFGQPRVIAGKFEDNIEALLSNQQRKNVFLYIDPYGIKALDFSLFEKCTKYNLNSMEILINFNSFGFFRDACRVMRVDVENDEAFSDLDDLVEYEPTEVSASPRSRELLNTIAGGDYWVDIVNDYQAKKITGYMAERVLSAAYKKRLNSVFQYVLDMPIRLKKGQRPKYRMIHACNHEDGCFLMAKNIQKRKDDLFINMQQKGQLSFADIGSAVSTTMDNELLSEAEINRRLVAHLEKVRGSIHLTKFLASFVNEHGIICEFNIIYKMLEELANSLNIEIIRNPSLTQNGKPRAFWEEKRGQTVVIRRLIE